MKYIKHLAVCLMGLISILYLLNIGVGIIELIPDNIPFLGNLDEAAAALLLINCLAYFGLDLRNLFSARKPKDPFIDV